MEDHDLLIEIREDVKHLKKAVDPIIQISQQNSMDIALLQRDQKWRSKLSNGFFGLLGVILGALAEFLRK